VVKDMRTDLAKHGVSNPTSWQDHPPTSPTREVTPTST
jgi:hypothetical protein